jgi:hypothetical protein
LIAKVNIPGRGPFERAQNVQKSAFPRTRLAYDCEHLTPADLKRQLVKEHQFSRARAKSFPKPFDSQRLLS